MTPLSLPSIVALTEVITGGPGIPNSQPVGIYRTGNQLEMFFGALNLRLDIGVRSRVPAEQ